MKTRVDSLLDRLDAETAPDSRPTKSVKIGVIGAGAFGTAMACVAGRSGHDVVIYARDKNQVEAINETNRNPRYLSDYELPLCVRATDRLQEALDGCTFVMLCIPAQLVCLYVTTIVSFLIIHPFRFQTG